MIQTLIVALEMDYVLLGRYEEAIGAYQKTIVINPQNSEYYIWLGHAFHDTKNLEGAIGAYKKPLKSIQVIHDLIFL